MNLMATKLTSELRDEIAANPHQAVPLVDEQSGKVCYLVDDEFLFGQVEQDERSRARLKALIDNGFASGDVSGGEQGLRVQFHRTSSHPALRRSAVSSVSATTRIVAPGGVRRSRTKPRTPSRKNGANSLAAPLANSSSRIVNRSSSDRPLR